LSVFLSRIALDTRLNNTRRAVASPAILHAAIEGCFFPRRDEGNERKLWRLDALSGKMYLLLLSPERPDFQRFAAQFCSADISGETKDYDALLAKVEAGSSWRFRLRANASHSEKSKDNARGKIYAHVTVEQQRAWLVKKAPGCGFSLAEDAFEVTASDTQQFRRGARQDKPIVLGVAVYEGTLAVTDAGLFRKALCSGIGRAKAYGCGLLTVARLP
jgi:CRISPR system Cascade subunit CasE